MLFDEEEKNNRCLLWTGLIMAAFPIYGVYHDWQNIVDEQGGEVGWFLGFNIIQYVLLWNLGLFAGMGGFKGFKGIVALLSLYNTVLLLVTLVALAVTVLTGTYTNDILGLLYVEVSICFVSWGYLGLAEDPEPEPTPDPEPEPEPTPDPEAQPIYYVMSKDGTHYQPAVMV